MVHHRLVIIGSGPAGYTAALYAARANLHPALITGFQQGGQLMTTTDVDNWPADHNGVLGPELMARFMKHAEKFDTRLITDNINAAFLQEKPMRLVGDLAAYTCDVLIIATGASAKYLGLPSEQHFLGRGVSGCATCDGFFYRDKPVVVIGGGNTALEEACYLSNMVSHVFVVHRRHQFRGEKIMVDRLARHVQEGRATIIWDHVVEEIVGDQNGVTGVVLSHVQSHKTQLIVVDGVFVAIGHSPNTKLFEDQLAMENGYIITKSGRFGGATATSLPGVFAAGDVQDHMYRQAVTASATGCMAALDAEKFMEQQRVGTGPW